MVVSRLFSSGSRNVSRRALLLSAAQKHQVPLLSNQLHSLAYESRNKIVTSQIPLLHHSVFNSFPFQRFGMSTSASPDPTEKETGSSSTAVDPTNAIVSDQTEASGGQTEAAGQKNESDSFSESQTNMSWTAWYIFCVSTVFYTLGTIRFYLHCFLHDYLLHRALIICKKDGVAINFECGWFNRIRITPVLLGDELQTAGYRQDDHTIRLDDHIIGPAEFENKGFVRGLLWKAITSLTLGVYTFTTRFNLIDDILKTYEKKDVLVAVEVGILGAKVTPVLRGDELQKGVVPVAIEFGLLQTKITPVPYRK